jgi:hypothetical protein
MSGMVRSISHASESSLAGVTSTTLFLKKSNSMADLPDPSKVSSGALALGVPRHEYAWSTLSSPYTPAATGQSKTSNVLRVALPA